MSDITIKYKDLTRQDQAVSLRLSDRATVGEVKNEIETITGIPRGQQTLFHGQKVLRDADTLCDLSNPDNATLKLLPRESITVNVQNKQGRTASFRVRLSDTVSSVKMRIQQEANLFLGDRHLSYAGREMADDLALSAYGLKSGSILTFDEEKTECYSEFADGDLSEDSGILDSSPVESDRQYSETVQDELQTVTARVAQLEENLSQVKKVQEGEKEERLKLQKELEESESIRKQFMQSFKVHQTLVDWVDSKLKGISEMSDKNLKVEIKSIRQDFTKKMSELAHTDNALAESLVRNKLESQKGDEFASCFHLKECKDLKMLCSRILLKATYTTVTDKENEKFNSLLEHYIHPIFLKYVKLVNKYMQHVVQNTFEATADQRRDCFNSNDLKVLVTLLESNFLKTAVGNKLDAHLAVCRLRNTLERKSKLGRKKGNDKTTEDLCKRLDAILAYVCPLKEEEYHQFHRERGTENIPPFKKINPTRSCYVHALLHEVLARPDALHLDVRAPMELEVDISGDVWEGTEEHERIFTCGEFKARIKGNGAKAKEQTTNYVKIVAFICNCLDLRLVKAKCMLYYLFGREAVTEKPVHEQLLYTFDQKSRHICFVDERENHEGGDAVEKHAICVVYEKIKM
ncbi:uncharacterized protein LOC106158739 isoform X2 [Lingula anatina]|uniref:Uncharacterized protein LOC106158739 isoform X2 n=1 Tax=Lingula anatina TaxID=7574 RepID=A0A1S3HW78_LINAN|nr:uncharacterized protein LOC106158739 isoform X2 [Lingula anatina]|eukprot:XP_013390273.1 uncharacterized protein LOC106158739 isoform X2 [Lingula anatina]